MLGYSVVNGENSTNSSVSKAWGTAQLIEMDDIGTAVAPEVAVNGRGGVAAIGWDAQQHLGEPLSVTATMGSDELCNSHRMNNGSDAQNKNAFPSSPCGVVPDISDNGS